MGTCFSFLWCFARKDVWSQKFASEGLQHYSISPRKRFSEVGFNNSSTLPSTLSFVLTVKCTVHIALRLSNLGYLLKNFVFLHSLIERCWCKS